MQEVPEFEVGHIVAGGAFGLSHEDVVFECRKYITYVMGNDRETYDVILDLLYMLSEDSTEH